MARHTKILLGPTRKNDPQVFEALAAVAILPGTFIAINGAGKFAPLTGDDMPRIAQENYLALRNTDTEYKVDDRVIGLEPQRDVLYAGRLAAGQNVTRVGYPLSVNASGHLILAAGDARVVAYADEAYNNDTGSTQLISIRPA